MSSSTLIVFTVSLLILTTVSYALGYAVDIGLNRMSHSLPDTSNIFKHDVRITSQEGLCSGTIISDKHVLTAAHCVLVKGTNRFLDIDKQPMEVTVGTIMVNNIFEFPTVRLVEKIYITRHYANTAQNEEDFKNAIGDIAVLKLNRELGLGRDPRIEAFKLPTYDFDNEEKNDIMFTGYGGTMAMYNPFEQQFKITQFPIYLQYSKAQVLPSSWCSNLGNAKLKMCARLSNVGAGTCGGDSGGGLINYKKKTVIGVLNYGPSSCDATSHSVYTKVFPYYSFIVNAMNDIVDEIGRVHSFATNANYQNALLQNYRKYTTIYFQ